VAVNGLQSGASGRARGWAFIDLAARGRNTAWSYVLTVAAVVLAPLVFLALTFVAIFLAALRHDVKEATAPVLVLMAAFVAVIVAGLTLALCVGRGHRRPWMSLISCDMRLDWRRLAIGAGVEGGLLLLFVGIARIVAGRQALSGPGMGMPALVLILVLVPFQAASEEMLFRGYLTQALGRVVRSRVAIAAIVGIAFGALHGGVYGPLTMPYLFGLSVLYSIVSLRDERLELTIGAHAATNWFGVSAANALNIAKGTVHLSLGALGVLVVNGALFYGLTRLLVRLLCKTERG
jgi:membrane protease YdiL (CAAX protease family)